MTIRDTIERLAREAADIIGWDPAKSAQHIERAIIAILTDPAVGFKEALEWIHNRPCGSCEAFPPCNGNDANLKDNLICTCPCHTAEAKLAEMKELEAKNG